jgi:hypothetical protein
MSKYERSGPRGVEYFPPHEIIAELRSENERLRASLSEMEANLRERNARITEAAAFLDRLADRMATPEGFFVETVIRDCRAMAAKLRALEGK